MATRGGLFQWQATLAFGKRPLRLSERWQLGSESHRSIGCTLGEREERVLGNEKRKEVETLRLRKEEGTPIRSRAAERMEPESWWVRRNQGEGRCIFHP